MNKDELFEKFMLPHTNHLKDLMKMSWNDTVVPYLAIPELPDKDEQEFERWYESMFKPIPEDKREYLFRHTRSAWMAALGKK